MINCGVRTAIEVGIVAAMFYISLLFSSFPSLSYLGILMVVNVLGFRWEYDQIDITW